MISHPVFNTDIFPNKMNLLNGKYWRYYLNSCYQYALNVFTVNRYFVIQKDGVRRLHSHFGFKHKKI